MDTFGKPAETCKLCFQLPDYHNEDGTCLFTPGTKYTNDIYAFEDILPLYWARINRPTSLRSIALAYHVSHPEAVKENWAAQKLWKEHQKEQAAHAS